MRSGTLSLCLALGLALTSSLPVQAQRVENSKIEKAGRNMTRFFTARPEELTADFVKGYYDALLAQMRDLPSDPGAWIDYLSHWNEFKAYLSGENQRRSLKESQNTADKSAEEGAAFMREKITPIAEEYDAQIRESLLASPFRAQMEKHFGKLLFSNFEVSQSAFDPANIKLNTEIGTLTARYGKIVGSAKLVIG
ncbi:MAG TPA: hypothetical protein V6C82_04620, partial [Chroococcales cyanobacterium]